MGGISTGPAETLIPRHFIHAVKSKVLPQAGLIGRLNIQLFMDCFTQLPYGGVFTMGAAGRRQALAAQQALFALMEEVGVGVQVGIDL